jgi:thiamine-phosphate pyrophosphorylase
VSARSSSASHRNPPILCYVTDRRGLPANAPSNPSGALTAKIEQAAAAGVDWVQVREKDLTARELAKLTGEALRQIADASLEQTHPAHVVVNDRLDVALTEDAGGVHLGEAGLPVDAVRRFVDSRGLRKSFLVGVSCHSLETAKSAARNASYIFFGPIFATPSKTGFGEPQGLGRLSEICASVAIPVLAIGGITPQNAAACVEAGAAGIAAIRMFQETKNLADLIEELRKSFR